jgi:hypothetical protein
MAKYPEATYLGVCFVPPITSKIVPTDCLANYSASTSAERKVLAWRTALPQNRFEHPSNIPQGANDFFLFVR